MDATPVAIDPTKDVSEQAFADSHARVIEHRRLSRNAFTCCLANRLPLRVVMAVCGSAHHWAQVFQVQGHAVRLPPGCDASADRHGVGSRPGRWRSRSDTATTGPQWRWRTSSHGGCGQ